MCSEQREALHTKIRAGVLCHDYIKRTNGVRQGLTRHGHSKIVYKSWASSTLCPDDIIGVDGMRRCAGLGPEQAGVSDVGCLPVG